MAQSDFQDESYDAIFMQIAGQIGSVQGLLDKFFGFMNRKTDFYVQYSESTQKASMGFPIGAAEIMLLRSFRKYSMKDYEKRTGCAAPNDAVNRTVTSNSAAKYDVAIASEQIISAFASKGHTAAKIADVNDRGLQKPIGNGGYADNYYWTQTLKEVTIYVDVQNVIVGKDVTCNLTPRSVCLRVKDDSFLEGEFEDAIRVDESIWTVQQNCTCFIFTFSAVVFNIL